MKLVVLFCLLSSFCFSLSAQYSETIATGRPGAANGAGTVGKGILQFQAGVQFDQISDTSSWYTNSISENLVVRFGIRERFEVSAVVNHINSTEFISEAEGSIVRKGLNSSLIRARTQVNANMALQIGIETRLRGEDYHIDYIAPRFRVMYNTSLGKNASLTTNLGGVWNGNDSKPQGFYVFSYSLALTNNLSIIAESYGNFARNGIDNYFDLGLGYGINKDLLIDVNAGWGENYPFKSYFVTAGVSYRLITRFRPEEDKQ